MAYADRHDAGRVLARELAPLVAERPLVVALPRGGVPVAAEVARQLGAPLELLVVRKLGAPGNPELGVGALAEDGTTVLDAELARRTGMTPAVLERTVAAERDELQRRVAAYRGGRPAAVVAGRSTIVVDDGLASGLSDLAAVRALRAAGAARIIVAVPVGSRQAVELLSGEADAVVCPLVPADLRAVGHWYEDFRPVGDAEVLAALRAADPARP